MGDKWRYAGPGEGIIGGTMQMLGMGGCETVENTETGELRKVFVGPGETVGEAIQRGQFVDED